MDWKEVGDLSRGEEGRGRLLQVGVLYVTPGPRPHMTMCRYTTDPLIMCAYSLSVDVHMVD